MYYYAAHNRHADVINGNKGFLNSWEISRFKARWARDLFVKRYTNKAAKAVNRREASHIWRDQYLSVGKNPPKYGLFYEDERTISYFWNELREDDI